MYRKSIILITLATLLSLCTITGPVPVVQAIPPDRTDYDAYPPFMANNPPPMVMLVMGRNHKLFYEAYNDASDLNEDGVLDITYKPDQIDYYGYFDSFKYYSYNTSSRQFEPVGAGVGANGKMVPGNNGWSGDFLNYLTMSRMDAIRKVLYGGYRVIDTPTETVLERAFIPQDAHSWGKEYESIARDGYDIRDYTPLPLPPATPVQTRHMFGSTSLTDFTDSTYAPLLRVMPNSPHRIWEWVAKERPVVDNSLEIPGGSTWLTVPGSTASGISNVTQSFYDISAGYPGHPANKTDFDNMIATYANAGNLQGSRTVTTIDGTGNPFNPGSNHYLSISQGTLNIPTTGTYTFSVDGDDAVELVIDLNGNSNFNDDSAVASWYGGHGSCGCNTYSGSVFLSAGTYQFQFRQEEATGGDNYFMRWQVSNAASTITDYRVRVLVGDPSMPETNCRQYPNGNFKPIGLLQRRGESESMYFGLISGSYTLNQSGGVLRKNISSIRDEIDSNDGTFTSLVGIIKTIDRFRIIDFRYSNHTYTGGWVTTRAMNQGEFPDWGNPVAEMMWEALRYYGGESGPTNAYHDNNMPDDDALGLPNVAWQDPYATFPYCTKPFILSLTDIYPTFDSDMVPGTAFGTMSASDVNGNGQTLDAESVADMIYSNEFAGGNRFIGSNNVIDDGACTSKAVSGFGDLRGLCPEEPTKQGSYYSAAVAHYGWMEDINPATDDQKVRTYTVGLASPLPNIEIPIQGQTIRLVPFAKSVGGCLGVVGTQGLFQPTNTIVDFFVEEIEPHRGRFRINYEDVEQGADHDMDAIVSYEYQMVDAAGNPVTAATIGSATAVDITLTSEYAAGCIIQHMGYIVSGSTADGTYLEVRDLDTGGDVDYFMDTPDPAWAASNTGLPLTHTRRFSPDAAGGASAAELLPNPLWFAAKWGGFMEETTTANGIPDDPAEWDEDSDGVPDTYYYVVNPLKLEQQLNRSFADIASNTSSGTAAAVVANNSEGQGTMIQAFFEPSYESKIDGKRIAWKGQLKSFWIDQFGHLREDSNSNDQLDFDVDKIIQYGTRADGSAFVDRFLTHYHYHPDNQVDPECVIATCTTTSERIGIDEIIPVFAAGEQLHKMPAHNRKIFTFLDGDGLDNDADGEIDESGENEGGNIVGQVAAPSSDAFNDGIGELVAFDSIAASRIKPYLGLKSSTRFTYLENGTPDHDTRVDNLIQYIRGVDSAGLVGNPRTRDRSMTSVRPPNNFGVWKLGDIVRSTPVNVAGAFEAYDLIYNDESYLDFIRKYHDRENVVYAGANDGMLHAFTHGQFKTDPTTNASMYEKTIGTSEEIGDELWAYIPQSVLPHLKWLADPDYGHAFYVDLKPKIFDARIFTPDTDHPGGWGTVLLVGLGAGGKRSWAEGDFDDNSGTPDVFRYFHPSYICLDVTVPRKPRLLWERSYDNLGMAMSFPTVLQVGATYDSNASTWSGGQWYAVVGSGPNDAIGKADYNGYSDQKGYIFVIDIQTGNLLRRFDTGMTQAVMAHGAALDKGSDDGTSPVDGLTYNVDAVYMGGASWDGNDWDGKMFKINTRETGTVPHVDPNRWSLFTLLESRPAYKIPAITAPPSLTVDLLDNVWVIFGTGRFAEMSDRATTEQNYLLGIKDPYFNSQPERSGYYLDNSIGLTLTLPDLFDSVPYESFDQTGTIAADTSNGGLARITDWSSLLGVVRNTENQSMPGNSDYFDGWVRALDARTPATLPSERIISKPAILSGIVFTPVYVPDDDICKFGGAADLYGVYYETGTPLWKHIFNASTATPNASVAYRSGNLVNTGPPPPMVSVHIGRSSGAKLFIQTGTGPVLESKVEVPPISSEVQYWMEPDATTP